MTNNINIILAFEAGRWLGQVDLEEHYDREQYGAALIEFTYSNKMSLPLNQTSNGKQALIQLRSDEWRAGVKKSCNDLIDKLLQKSEVQNEN